MKRRYLVSSILLLLLSAGCKKSMVSKNDEASKTNVEQSIFTVVPEEQSNIHFTNVLKENEYMNGIFYEYFYNGSGVAVGDFNNDGWEDIYFVSTISKNKLYINNKNMSFIDVTKQANADSGVGFDSGITTVDINQDGLLDIYICRTGRFQDEDPRRNVLLVNKGIKNGIPYFEDMASAYGLDSPAFSTQAGFFDYDNDGDLDMFLINHGIDTYPEDEISKLKSIASKYRGERLFRNDSGKFKDVTTESGIINNMLGYGLGLAFGDLNNDGWADIYISNDFSGQDHLYINNRNGTFSEVAKQATRHISNFSMGNDIADFNNDGWLDIVALDMMAEDNYGIKTSMSSMNPARFYRHVDAGLHYQYMYNTLQLNNGVDTKSGLPKFSDIAQMAGISSTDWSWASLFMDMDNDGNKDLFISNGIKRDFRNNDFVKYRSKKEQALRSGDVNVKKTFIDDLLSKMPTKKKHNYFYVNDGDLTFKKVLIEQPETNSNGAAYADFDNDGDMDIVVNNSESPSYIYENKSDKNTANTYMKFLFEGPQSNRNGIGTRVKVYQNDKIQLQEQYVTKGFQSSVSHIMHFGLGNDKEIDSIEVTWFDGKKQVIKDAEANQLLKVSYSEAKQKPVKASKESLMFKDITKQSNLVVKHDENEFFDFDREELLPHKMSIMGPALAITDLNNDGLDDFYVGGASGYPGQLFIQLDNGNFQKAKTPVFESDKIHEDVDALFVDVEGDGDMDLYVVSGGNEFEQGHANLGDRLYINDGSGGFKRDKSALPAIAVSGSRVKAADFDNDGDLDFFVGGRQLPGKYPFPGRSLLLENRTENGVLKFIEISNDKAPFLKDLGMVTDAVWMDFNNDKLLDLIVVGEWMPVTFLKNNGKAFTNETKTYEMENQTGWWNSIEAADFDGDGDTDLIVGNLGLNYKYKATQNEPFEVYAKDFDNNSSLDIVLGYYNGGDLFPLRGRQCSSNQMPFIKEKFPTYNEFGSATLVKVYGERNLEDALHYKANTFATTYFENVNNKSFNAYPLSNEVQTSSVNDILVNDFDKDTKLDVLMVGNLYGSEVETPRNDASYGFYLKGLGRTGITNFEVVPAQKNGLYIEGDSKAVRLLHTKEGSVLLVAKNNDYLQLIKIK
ncbi:VCBS repeat-containing protein [Snuella sedimenti]|uniref:VCBS repeat-containing protein n=1 Tax=Snuella sedimenti TaxID=2798802 RepID=A0A8J7IZX8_9FLAO|nr:VCBS repeat-containing protein [Snuella sedimenti]MBJ6369755.1 VCBS repeat-containing protein [Snuella sedimenti]